MSSDDETTTTEIEDRLQHLGRYSRFVKVGFGVILGAFLLAAAVLVPANLESVESVVDVMLMPLIFVGMGLLLFGIGMHLHLMHLNLVRQLRKGGD
ncbi:hypothetical protein [Haloarcula salinisoli]|uniref:Uncharacterized protein n=1 Tax=Haloarcula salinisoli TaxID=2487746 RepID=A0A8J7YJL1_9EURY|nr:hypothetical protein [Halomicroarcula salinisoli]MBX0286569.1 hypothetical protein [Halomicroarcula salinisoli]MBX0303919.1 hypothetical protein [Halomicroarcula salinisoli]